MTLLIKKLRIEKGWSQRRLSEIAKVPKSSLGDIETHKQLPKKDQLERIAEALGVTVDDLYLKNFKGESI